VKTNKNISEVVPFKAPEIQEINERDVAKSVGGRNKKKTNKPLD
jgi:hypothetical protein